MKRNTSIYGILAYACLLVAMLTSYLGVFVPGPWTIVSAVAMTVFVMCFPFTIILRPENI